MLAPSSDGTTQLGRRRRPVRVHDEELDDVAPGDDREEDDDHPLEPVVRLPEDGDEDEAHGDGRTEPERDAEEKVEAERGAEVLGDVGGDAGEDDGDAGDPDDGPRQAPTNVDGERAAGDDAELRRQVLQEDQHQRAERDDPEQVVAELGAAGDVRRPVAGVDEADRDDEPRAQVAQQLAREQVVEEAARGRGGRRGHGDLFRTVRRGSPPGGGPVRRVQLYRRRRLRRQHPAWRRGHEHAGRSARRKRTAGAA